MRPGSIAFNVFLAGIFLSSVIYSPFILDFTLTTRLICSSVISCICFYLIYLKKDLKIQFDIVTGSYLCFVIYSCLSVFWANTASESYFENSKLVISFLIFILSFYFLKENKELFMGSFIKLSIVVVGIELIIVSYQLSKLHAFNKEDLYSVYGLNSHKNLLSSFLYLQLFFLVMGIRNFQKGWKYLSVIALIIVQAT